MTLTYRTRRRLQRGGFIAAVVAIILILGWIIAALWMERYVVFSREGASVNLQRPISAAPGEPARRPQAQGSVSIYYNEGSDAIELTSELNPVVGYYISYDDLSKNMDKVLEDMKYLTSGTAVMIELKGGYGTFYYSSKLAEAVPSASVPIAQVDKLIELLQSKGYYTIAKVSALRSYVYGNAHVAQGLFMLSRAGLWMDPGGCYWLNPTDVNVQNWIISIVNEVRGLGFNEVLLADFAFPNSDKYIFNDDKEAALLGCAVKIMEECQKDYFTVSFGVSSSAFNLPEGRNRIYLEGVDPMNVQTIFSQASFENPEARLVFLGTTNDTRYNGYSVLRPLALAEEAENRRKELASMNQ